MASKAYFKPLSSRHHWIWRAFILY